ncbi:MAG: metal-dependent transcriptional regulator [Candidatus Eisenbacteria bacterium]|nr:metal-dependent transcriptional regulator [Candidatus Eisenbacteria bacterium]
MLSERAADYLETIYLLSLRQDTVGVSEVAEERGVTTPTARAAIGRLKADGFVRQRRYGKVVLTESGRRRAATVYKRHTVLFRFLHDILGVAPEQADAEACRLEHGLSEETLEKLVLFLDGHEGVANAS